MTLDELEPIAEQMAVVLDSHLSGVGTHTEMRDALRAYWAIVECKPLESEYGRPVEVTSHPERCRHPLAQEQSAFGFTWGYCPSCGENWTNAA